MPWADRCARRFDRVAEATGAGVSGARVARFSANGATPARFTDVTKRHGAPGLAVLAGVQGLAQAWTTLKNGLPKARTGFHVERCALKLASGFFSGLHGALRTPG